MHYFEEKILHFDDDRVKLQAAWTAMKDILLQQKWDLQRSLVECLKENERIAEKNLKCQ